MPKYEPIDVGVPLQASRADLAHFAWSLDGITADFHIPHRAGCLLRVSFNKACIIRLLDEMALSTETDDSPDEGLVGEYLAYRLDGAAFARSQSSYWLADGSVSHYRFITGLTCMDVLSAASPSFSVTEPALEAKT